MKFKIFISSVQAEFAEERRKLAEYIRRDVLLGVFFDPFLFEEVAACDRMPQDVYLKEVEDFKTIIWRKGAVEGHSQGTVGIKSGPGWDQDMAPVVAPVVAPVGSERALPNNTMGRVLNVLSQSEHSRTEIALALGITRKARSITLAIDELIEDGLIERTISDPKKRNSRLQKYRLTEKGKAALESPADAAATIFVGHM